MTPAQMAAMHRICQSHPQLAIDFVRFMDLPYGEFVIRRRNGMVVHGAVTEHRNYFPEPEEGDLQAAR